MAKNKNKRKKKPLFFRILRWFVGVCYGKKGFSGIENIPDEPSIIVGNHAQAHGPMVAELWFPKKKKIWLIGNMMSAKEIPAYAMQDFWPYKPKSVRWIYKIFSYLIAPLFAFVFKNVDGIGVYKDSRIIKTFKQSVESLKDGAHVIIFPECHTEYNHVVNEFQTNFVDLARLYYKNTGKEISFVPMYNAPNLKLTVFGKPIKFDCDKDANLQRKEICDFIKSEITSLAEQLPVHRVVPYANIKKKDYPYSRKVE